MDIPIQPRQTRAQRRNNGNVPFLELDDRNQPRVNNRDQLRIENQRIREQEAILSRQRQEQLLQQQQQQQPEPQSEEEDNEEAEEEEEPEPQPAANPRTPPPVIQNLLHTPPAFAVNHGSSPPQPPEFQTPPAQQPFGPVNINNLPAGWEPVQPVQISPADSGIDIHTPTPPHPVPQAPQVFSPNLHPQAWEPVDPADLEENENDGWDVEQLGAELDEIAALAGSPGDGNPNHNYNPNLPQQQQPSSSPPLANNWAGDGNGYHQGNNGEGNGNGSPPSSGSPPRHYLVPEGHVAGRWSGSFVNLGQEEPSAVVADEAAGNRAEQEPMVLGYNGAEVEQELPRHGNVGDDAEEQEEQHSENESEGAAAACFGEEPGDSSLSGEEDRDAAGAHERRESFDSSSSPSSSSSSSSSGGPDYYQENPELPQLPPPSSQGQQPQQQQDPVTPVRSEQGEPRPPRSSSLPDFDDEQWEQEERDLARRNQRNSPLRWFERGHAVQPLRQSPPLQGDLAILPEGRLQGQDSVETNALRWSRPRLDFGEHSRPPALPSDFSSEEDWDEDEEDDEGNKSSCTGSTSSTVKNGGEGSDDSDDESPPVGMPVTGTGQTSSQVASSSPSAGQQQRSSPPSSPPDSQSPSKSGKDYEVRDHTGAPDFWWDKWKFRRPQTTTASASSPEAPKKNSKKKGGRPVPYRLNLAIEPQETGTGQTDWWRDLEDDWAARTARSNAPPPSAGITTAVRGITKSAQQPLNATSKDATPGPKEQQRQQPRGRPMTPAQKPSLRRNSAGPFHHASYPSTTVFREDFSFVPREGRRSGPNSVSGDDGSSRTMPDYVGRGDQDISPQTKNPPKVPQTGHVAPGTREARVQVGGKGFPQVLNDKGRTVYDAGGLYIEQAKEEEQGEEGEEVTPTKAQRRGSEDATNCPTFSAERYLQRQQQEQQQEEREQEEAQEPEAEAEEETAATYYQYHPRYDEQGGYSYSTRGLTGTGTGTSIPQWMSGATVTGAFSNPPSPFPRYTSWVSFQEPSSASTVTTIASLAKSLPSTSGAKRSISSISDYDDDDESDNQSIRSLAMRLRSFPDPLPKGKPASPKRGRSGYQGEDDGEGERYNKRPRTEAFALGANFVGFTTGGQQQGDGEENGQEDVEMYDPAMIEDEEYDPRTVGLLHGTNQGSSRSRASSVAGSTTSRSRRYRSTEYDPVTDVTEREEEGYDPKHPAP